MHTDCGTQQNAHHKNAALDYIALLRCISRVGFLTAFPKLCRDLSLHKLVSTVRLDRLVGHLSPPVVGHLSPPVVGHLSPLDRLVGHLSPLHRKIQTLTENYYKPNTDYTKHTLKSKNAEI